MERGFDPAAWSALDPRSRIDWLRERRLLAIQAPALARESDRGLWAQGDDPNPLHALIDLGEREGALDALALGATPFGGGLPASSPFGLALGLLGNRQCDGALIRALWSSAEPFLDPSSPLFAGATEASHALATLAVEAYREGALSEAAACGAPIGLPWFKFLANPAGDFDEGHPWLRPFFIDSGRAEDLELLAAQGLDLASPLAATDGPQSLWLWLGDDVPDALRRGACLLRAGSDPRKPLAPGQPSPLDTMRGDGRATELLGALESMLLALDEREALGAILAAAEPGPISRAL